MLLNLERLDLLVAHYVAGCLPEPAHVLVGAHLEMQPSAGQVAGRLEELAGQALESIEPSPVSAAATRLKAIFESRPQVTPPPLMPVDLPGGGKSNDKSNDRGGDDGQRFPHFLRSYAGADFGDVPWKTRLPGLKQHVIEKSSGMEASLLWARPGRALPHHRHRGLELTLVLKGAFQDHRGAFAEGDVSVADETIVHRPVATTDGPCLCFSVLLAPIALSGPALKVVADILGL
jgi:putative transcriptional regulator